MRTHQRSPADCVSNLASADTQAIDGGQQVAAGGQFRHKRRCSGREACSPTSCSLVAEYMMILICGFTCAIRRRYLSLKQRRE
jgi:hypothetical protein